MQAYWLPHPLCCKNLVWPGSGSQPELPLLLAHEPAHQSTWCCLWPWRWCSWWGSSHHRCCGWGRSSAAAAVAQTRSKSLHQLAAKSVILLLPLLLLLCQGSMALHQLLHCLGQCLVELLLAQLTLAHLLLQPPHICFLVDLPLHSAPLLLPTAQPPASAELPSRPAHLPPRLALPPL